MPVYYHGTSDEKFESIQANGIRLGTSEDNTFGPGLYMCDNLEDAKSFGMVAISIEVDNSDVYVCLMEEDDIEYEDEEWPKVFAQNILDMGYKIANIIREDGANEIVIYDLSCVSGISEAWRSPLLRD